MPSVNVVQMYEIQDVIVRSVIRLLQCSAPTGNYINMVFSFAHERLLHLSVPGDA